MSIEGNMRRSDLFIIEIDGVDQLEIQEMTLPDVEHGIITHGAGINRPDRKTAGKRKVGEMVFKKIAPIDGVDTFAWTMFELAANSPQSLAARTVILRMMNENGTRTVARYLMLNAWVQKIKGLELKRGGDAENIMQEVTMAVDDLVNPEETIKGLTGGFV